MKVVIYPIENPIKSSTNNPYISDTIEALEENGHTIINKNKYSNLGLLSLFPHFFKMDVIYLNWIEDVSERRFGYIQNLLLLLLIPLFKILNKKIIWLMHNKISHSKKNRLLKIINYYFLINKSDIVITHAMDGISFGNSFLKKERKIYFKHHPMKIQNLENTENKIYDILIWGAITKYKGVLEFLESSDYLIKKYKICIAGKINDKKLKDEIQSYQCENLTILNEFISNEKLDKLFIQSKIILFTYSGYSTLSSGSLMHSIERKCKVIGPEIGAFKDLKEEEIIDTYKNFTQLHKIIDNNIKTLDNTKNKIEKFIHKNSLNQFGKFVSELLKEEI